jgi:hypothetical protein
MLAAILQSIADFTRVKCDVNTPPAPLGKGGYSLKLIQPGAGG